MPDITPVTIKTDGEGHALVGDETEVNYHNKEFEVRRRTKDELDEIRMPTSDEIKMSISRSASRAVSRAGSAAPSPRGFSRASSVRGGSAAPLSLSRNQSFNGSIAPSLSREGSWKKAGTFNGRSNCSVVSSRTGGGGSIAMSATPSKGSATPMYIDPDDQAAVFNSQKLDTSAMMFDLKLEARREAAPDKTDADFLKEDMDNDKEVAAKKMGLTRVSSKAKPGAVKEVTQSIEEREAARRRKEFVKAHAMAVSVCHSVQ